MKEIRMRFEGYSVEFCWEYKNNSQFEMAIARVDEELKSAAVGIFEIIKALNWVRLEEKGIFKGKNVFEENFEIEIR